MKEKGLLRERSYSAAVPYIMEDIDEETRRKYNDVIRKEFDSTYPYVIELGDKVCRKDKIRLRLFKINKNLAARIYNMYLKGLDR